jgi:uncharacterized protein YciI
VWFRLGPLDSALQQCAHHMARLSLASCRERLAACGPFVGIEGVRTDAIAPRSRPMPRAATDAAVKTFASITRKHYPGVSLLPLRRIRADRAVVPASPRQVIWPFAPPEDRYALPDGDAGVGALHDNRVD